MHRRFTIALAASACLGLAGTPDAPGQTPGELIRTAAYQEAFQNPDGGFAERPGGPSSLGATSSACRTLGYVGGSIRDVAGAIGFVKSCFDPASGGFAPAPGGEADPGATASGLMALPALKMDPAPFAEKAVAFLAKEARTFEEVRLAVAGLEAVKAAPPDSAHWADLVTKDRNPDGTFGSGSGRARATGSAVVALLRMGIKPDDAQKSAILAALRDGQRPDGGWSAGEGPSDLISSYRIMRCFFMLKEKPDLDRLRAYLAAHRQADGGYGTTPGAASSPGGTYTCSIMGHWARLLGGEPALVETAGFRPLFNGKDLAGWEGEGSLWSARDGVLVGDSPGIKENQFLATEASYGDFILKYSVRLAGDSGNSGVQFRSVRVPGTEMSGYQADIGPGWWGCLYDESRRNKILEKASSKAVDALHKGDWNHVTIRAMGNHITITLNGATAVDYREPDAGIARDGRIAVQIHAGGPMKVEFKDIYIQPLPMPKGDDPAFAADSPGFHLRTIKAEGGERKYTVYVPQGYDGSKAMPAVLFLHGSGERGDDGIQGGQIGLGAAILAHPERFPAIVVLPQAKETWRADSADAKAALAALDDAMATYKIDPDRVALTGLSMGGSGTWSIASADPGRFSGIATICGRGRVEMVQALKAVPTWTVVGDGDGDAVVQNLRQMAQAFRDAGAPVHQTEYRAVGHNSWDRAYDDPALIAWLLARSRKGR